MSTILRVTKTVDESRALMPAVGVEGTYRGRNAIGMIVHFALPFKTASGGTAMLQEDRDPYIEVYLPEDAVEIVSADPDFVLKDSVGGKGNYGFDRLNDAQKILISFCVNGYGDGRCALASKENLDKFSLDYVQDCIKAMIDDGSVLGELPDVIEGVTNILEILSEPSEDVLIPVIGNR